MNKDTGPSFIGIGVQKSATTWLAEMLRLHPEVFLTPAKEIHYFDRDKKYPSPNYWIYNNIIKRFISKETRRFHTRGILSGIKKLLLYRDYESFYWRLKFHFTLKINDDWYISLFKTKRKYFAAGEITPAYSLLEDNEIKRIKEINSNIKIILILRNPIERAWSFLRWEWQLGNIDIKSKENVMSVLISDSFLKRGNYNSILNKWLKHFRKSQIKILFYDEIRNSPKSVLTSVFKFINVNPEHFDYSNCKKIVAASKKMLIPDWIEIELKKIFEPSMAEIASELGGYAGIWYDTTFC